MVTTLTNTAETARVPMSDINRMALSDAPTRHYPLLLCCFIGSGCAALIYEIVWVKGAAAPYTKEFFALIKRHLNPGGVITQWVPLYETTPATVRSEMATFFSEFPDGHAFVNDFDGGADVVLFGQAEPAPVNVDDIARRFDLPENARAAEAPRELDF